MGVGAAAVVADDLPFIIAQAPTAHMAAQGASERMIGATPMAVSQFQPSANPTATTAMPATIKPRRPVSQWRRKPPTPSARGAAGAGLMFALTPGQSQEQSSAPSATIGGPFSLVDVKGETVTDQTYRGKWMLIYFGYTFCPDACPTALTNISGALATLGPEAEKIEPLFITVDPKRDTPKVMADYLQSFDLRIVGLTGSQAQTDSAAKAYRVYVAPQKDAGDGYLVDHSAFFYVMNPQGKFVNIIAGDASGAGIADKLRAMMAHAGA